MYEATAENIDISWTDVNSPAGPPDGDDLTTLIGVTMLVIAIVILCIL